MRIIVFLIVAMMFSSCFEPDIRINSPSPSQLRLTSDVSNNQAVYIDLSNLKTDQNPFEKKWHLKFQNAKNSWSIYLNPLENVAIHQTTITNFDEVDSNFYLVGLKWQIDAPSTKGAYPAFAAWGDFNFEVPKSFKNVYIIRLKNDITATFYKVQILDASSNTYRLRYASLNGKIDHVVSINKDDSYTHSFLRLGEEPRQPRVEPKKEDWDLCLTYIADSINKQGELPYFPTINPYYGVYQAFLVNNSFNQIAIDSIHTFDEIDFFKIQSLSFKSIDQLHNILIDWNHQEQEAHISTKAFLIVKSNGSYYAIKPEEIIGEYPTKFDLQLTVKQL